MHSCKLLACAWIATSGVILQEHVATSRGSFEIVACRWGEDVGWIRELGLPHLIYDKGKGNALPSEFNTVPVERNVGKENYCYLTHILRNYDSQMKNGHGLASITLFSQADPFDHVDASFLPAVKTLAHTGLKEDWFRSFGKKTLEIDAKGCPSFCSDEEWLARVYSHIFYRWPDANKTFPLQFKPGAIFAVSRDAILGRPKHFYENILSLVDKEVDPLTGHGLEVSSILPSCYAVNSLACLALVGKDFRS